MPYRELPNSNDARQVLQYVLDSGISAIELMGPVAENFAGAPSAAPAGGGGPAPLTPEQQTAPQNVQRRRRRHLRL